MYTPLNKEFYFTPYYILKYFVQKYEHVQDDVDNSMQGIRSNGYIIKKVTFKRKDGGYEVEKCPIGPAPICENCTLLKDCYMRVALKHNS